MNPSAVLILPGWQNSGPLHWQSRWEAVHGYQRVAQHDWQRPLRGDWTARLEDVLLDLWNAEKRTVLFITHDLNEAVTMSDRVVVMSPRPGRIIADIPIPLPRPRSVRALQKDPHYH